MEEDEEAMAKKQQRREAPWKTPEGHIQGPLRAAAAAGESEIAGFLRSLATRHHKPIKLTRKKASKKAEKGSLLQVDGDPVLVNEIKL